MRHAMSVASGFVVLAMACCGALAQGAPYDLENEGNDNPRGNVNLGTPIVIPLNPSAQAVHLGFGVTVGGGFNFTRQHAAVGEFMWNNLLPTNGALADLRTGLGNPSINATVRMTALTGNYRYEMRGRTLGAYLIAGGGLYYRSTSISQKVTTGSSITCTPSLEFLGFTCTSGTVTANQTLATFAVSKGGVNGGVGFTVRVGEPPYRFYVESRYHYVPYSQINMQMIQISFGIRY